MLQLIGPVLGLLDKFIPDAGEKQRLAHEIATKVGDQAFEIARGQLDVNKQEAAHKSLFVAGWRPFIGWVCGVSLAFNYMGVPLGNFILAVNESAIKIPPLDLSTMMPVLMGMLGLGAMRTTEKVKGVSREK